MTDRIDNPTGPSRTGNPGGAGGDRDIQPSGDESIGTGYERNRGGQSGAPRQPQPDKPDVNKGGNSYPNTGK
jgi:hypothetical protein